MSTAAAFADAELVVEGTLSRSPRYEESDDGMVLTVYELAVAGSLVGESPGATIEVVVPGGVSSRGVLVIPGLPSFEAGESVVLALRPEPLGSRWSLARVTNAVFRAVVRNDGEWVAADHAGVPLVEVACGAAPLRAFPVGQAPAENVDGFAASLAGVEPGIMAPVFVDRPEEHAMVWTDLVATLRGCAPPVGGEAP